ncbi:MAG: polymer-forming cytoskeletal protein [Patescibacteria group bacterium]
MAIFPKDDRELKETETLIGPSVKVEGNFYGKGDVVVEGEVQGTLRTAKNLRVGSGAKIKADVAAENIHLSGQIRGNVKAREKIELAETAKLIGNLETKVISIAAGAQFNGKCMMVSEADVKEDMEIDPRTNNQKGRNNNKK